MSYIISEESGTCGPLPVRNSWGLPVSTTWWNAESDSSDKERTAA
jgi:hypothetical protein